MAQSMFIGRDPILKRWRTLYREFKKKSATPVLFVRVSGPAGVGRSALVDFIKKDLEKGGALWEFSCLEGPLLSRLRAAVSTKQKDLAQAWIRRLEALGPRKRAAIVLRDLHELEDFEKGPTEQLLQRLAGAARPLLVLLESRGSRAALNIHIPARQMVNLEVKPLSAKDVAAWLKRFGAIRSLPPKVGKKFFQKTRGLPGLMVLWGHYLKKHVSDFLNSAKLKDWPGDRSKLMDKILAALGPAETGLLQVWALQPSWLNRAALSAGTGLSAPRVGAALKNFSQWGWVEASVAAPPRYFLKEAELAERAALPLKPAAKQLIHRNLFSFFVSHPWLYRETWLAYHASQGGMIRQAFAWNILAGESYEGRDQLDAAQSYYGYAMDLARDDFQRAYLRGILGETYLKQKKFPLAWSSLQEANGLAEKIPWPEFQQTFNLSLGQMLSHLGRYRQGGDYYLRALQAIDSRDLEEDRCKVRFQLGMCYLEQARYGDAEKIFLELNEYYRKKEDALGRMGVQLSLLQIYIALGRVRAAYTLMEETRQGLRELPPSLWEPLFQLLVAKLHTTQGRFGSALNILEEAARGFEANSDLHGKVEVLLAMSAPMLEYGLIAEAQRIMELLGDWSDLGETPALQHSIQLRRMAVSAFSGKWVEEDFALAGKNALDVGRTEDWLLFWFHLALASRNFPDPKFFNYFIGKAQELARQISGQLDAGSAESFLHRPDVARIFRLSEEKKAGARAAVSARRETEAKGPAEAATLAPPVRGPVK